MAMATIIPSLPSVENARFITLTFGVPQSGWPVANQVAKSNIRIHSAASRMIDRLDVSLEGRNKETIRTV